MSLILYYFIEVNVTISADYNPAPGEVPGELGPNKFTAGSELTLNCIVHGNSGALTYVWSVMGNPDTTDCDDCVIIDTSSPTTSTLSLGQPALYSYFAGIYTCTVTESDGPEGSRNTENFTVAVVGNDNHHIVCIRSSVIIYVGAGLYVDKRMDDSDFDPHPIANNSLIRSGSDGLRLYCVSNSSLSGVGTITTNSGSELDTGPTGIWYVVHPSKISGVVRLQNRIVSNMPMLITPSDQGIYTCNVTDDNGNDFIFNVGLYPSDFNGMYSYISERYLTLSFPLLQTLPPSLT